jgi:alkylhydroperoxidase family enzyme
LSSPQNACRPWRPFFLSEEKAKLKYIDGVTKALEKLNKAVAQKFNSVQILDGCQPRAIFIAGALVNDPVMQVK